MRPTQHIVNVSGGKDSDCCYLLALERGVPFRAIFADTGNEHPLTYEHIRLLPQRTGGPEVEWVRADFSAQIARKREYIRLNWPRKGVSLGTVARALFIMQPTGIPMLDLGLWKGRFSDRRTKFCTEELKVFPINEKIIFPALRAGPVLQWLGERAEESLRRAAKPRFNRGDTGAWLWRPLKHWKIEQVLEIHRRHALPLNPLYSMGMDRVGCMPCFQCGKEETRQIAARFPEHINKIAEWEEIVSQASKMRLARFFPPKRAGLPNDARSVADWARSTRGGRNYNLLHEMDDTTSGCHSSYGLCE